MGKAGQALRQTLEKHKISQYRLAEVMGIERNNISRWVREERDPTAENVLAITRALLKISEEAGKEFAYLYMGTELN